MANHKRLSLRVLLFAIALTPALQAQPRSGPETECTESAELFVRVVRSGGLPPIEVPGFTISLSGASSALIKQNACKPGQQKSALPKFDWKLDAPPGSQAVLQNTNTLNVSFTPTVPGTHTVRLIACPATCKIRLVTAFTPTKKPVIEEVAIEPKDFKITFEVEESAQVPPLFVPAALPKPFRNATELVPDTTPGDYSRARGFCDSAIEVGSSLSAQWYTTTEFPPNTPAFALAEGRVYHSLVSRKDHPASHNSNDANMLIELDPHLRNLLVPDEPEDKGPLLPFGGLEIEWETNELPEPFRAINGDRVSALGYHVIDCGHEKYTEIHPPVAIAVHRPRVVLLPQSVAFREGGPLQSLGSNVMVPGIITDIWANLRGGQALDCDSASIHIPTRIQLPNGITTTPCAPQPAAAGKTFTFHVYLPPNPAFRLRQLGVNPAFTPALHVAITEHPDATALGARKDIPVTVIEKRLDGSTPYIVVSVDLSRMSTGQKFAKRLFAGWVYPDLESTNFGLRALRVRLNHLKVTDDGDPWEKGDGDWNFWVGIPVINRPWTKLIGCGGCVEEKTYTPTNGPWKPGALAADGGIGASDLLLFGGQASTIQFGGFEEDSLTSDDTGTVLDSLGLLLTRNSKSTCNDQTVGGLNDLDPSTSSCAAYEVNYTVEAGQTKTTATLTAEAKAAFEQLLVQARVRKQMPAVLDSELYRNDDISPQRRKLTTDRRGEIETWQERSSTARLGAELQTPPGEAMVEDLRKHVLQLLGPNPTPKHRRKIALELQELKKSVPPELYRKHLCDLETGAPCPVP